MTREESERVFQRWLNGTAIAMELEEAMSATLEREKTARDDGLEAGLEEAARHVDILARHADRENGHDAVLSIAADGIRALKSRQP
jgi:hypothetical protein